MLLLTELQCPQGPPLITGPLCTEHWCTLQRVLTHVCPHHAAPRILCTDEEAVGSGRLVGLLQPSSVTAPLPPECIHVWPRAPVHGREFHSGPLPWVSPRPRVLPAHTAQAGWGPLPQTQNGALWSCPAFSSLSEAARNQLIHSAPTY